MNTFFACLPVAPLRDFWIQLVIASAAASTSLPFLLADTDFGIMLAVGKILAAVA